MHARVKTSLYWLALVLSLPNLLAGLAVAVVEHTFVTLNPLLLILNFFEAVMWGVPVTVGLFLVLAMAGCFFETRAYATVLALALNAVALTLVLVRVRPPADAFEAVLFVPVAVAMGVFAWLAWSEFTTRRARLR